MEALTLRTAAEAALNNYLDFLGEDPDTVLEMVIDRS